MYFVTKQYVVYANVNGNAVLVLVDFVRLCSKNGFFFYMGNNISQKKKTIIIRRIFLVCYQFYQYVYSWIFDFHTITLDLQRTRTEFRKHAFVLL